jgi:hypothetical protein
MTVIRDDPIDPDGHHLGVVCRTGARLPGSLGAHRYYATWAQERKSRPRPIPSSLAGIVARSSLSKKIRRPNRARQVCKDSPLEGWREVDSNFRFRAAG